MRNALRKAESNFFLLRNNRRLLGHGGDGTFGSVPGQESGRAGSANADSNSPAKIQLSG
ncbi:hypothetical protein GCM10009682_49600 [Luedemannella flava]|uniref:Uncharacterized protein n=1 Tax=Luedemannella flava TaxID=349316 RepID=A0ABP4YPT3_9ACTN